MIDRDPWGQGPRRRTPKGWKNTKPGEWIYVGEGFGKPPTSISSVPPRAISSEARRKAQAKRSAKRTSR